MTSLEVVPAAPEQEPILANLIELYTHDFSEFHEIELGEDGRFGYQDLRLYWSEPDRHPFLIRIDGKLAGFALVKRSGAAVWDMAEFFVVRRYRRRGIGVAVAHDVWRRFPGQWQIRVMESNHSGHAFWERAIAAFAGEVVVPRVEYGWRVFSFLVP